MPTGPSKPVGAVFVTDIVAICAMSVDEQFRQLTKALLK
jgi:hypothetical protein